jgi:hypothetical protein
MVVRVLVAVMHEEVHRRAEEQQDVGQRSEQVSAMFGPQEEGDDGHEHPEADS